MLNMVNPVQAPWLLRAPREVLLMACLGLLRGCSSPGAGSVSQGTDLCRAATGPALPWCRAPSGGHRRAASLKPWTTLLSQSFWAPPSPHLQPPGLPQALHSQCCKVAVLQVAGPLLYLHLGEEVEGRSGTFRLQSGSQNTASAADFTHFCKLGN